MILDRIGNGETVRVKIALESEERANLQTASVLGTLPGTTDEDIIIVAHMDGYFDGAIDNGSGLAVMMGLLEHFSKVPMAERRRKIIFLGSAGHHGGPGTRWLHDERDTVLAKTALIINLEHVSAVRTKYWGPHLRKTNAVSPMRWWVWGGPKVLDIALQAFARFNVSLTADMDTGAWRDRPGGARRPVHAGDHVSRGQTFRGRHRRVGAGRRAGTSRPRACAKIIDEINRLPRRDLLPVAAGGATAAGRPRAPLTRCRRSTD